MRIRRWRAFLAAAAVAIVAYQAIEGAGLLGVVLYNGLGAAAVGGLLVGAVRTPRGRRLPWGLLGGGLALYALGDVIYYVQQVIDPELSTFPGLADAAYFGSYPLLTAGTLLLIRARTPGRDLPALVDAAVISLGIGLLWWQFLVEPLATDPALPALARFEAMVYPVLDLVLFAVGVRLVVGAGRRPPAFLLLISGLAVMLVTDVGYGLSVVLDRYVVGGLLEGGWMLFYALVGAAGLHPSALELTRRAEAVEPRLTTRRLVLLAAACLLAPVVDGVRGRDPVDTTLALATILLFGLVIGRMVGLMRALEGSMAQVTDLQRLRGERRFASLVERAADIVVVVDAAGAVTYASPSCRALLGADPTALSGEQLADAVHPDDAGQLAAYVLSASTAGSGEAPALQFRVRHSDGSWRVVEVLATNLLDDPDVAGTVLNARDVTERHALEGRLRHLALHDPLTGLPNRSLFADRVEHALERGARAGGTVAVLLCDLDDFKTVNDSLGHAAGDQLLLGVADRLRATLRSGDTAARLGGDEFAVLLEDLAGPQAAEEAAERVLAVLRAPWSVAGADVAGSSSIGLAAGDDVRDASELLRNADAALHEAKAAGKGGWTWYQPAMHTGALRRLQLTAELDRALERGEFFLAYQPVVDLASTSTVGVEALVRWRHPALGLVGPGEFIAVAEATGHIVALGEWVLEQACRQARAWLDELGPQAMFSVSVNVSARQLADPQLVGAVVRALERSRLDPARLVLELTESVLVHDADHALAAFTALKQLGLRLAIDDFGTGYSSLSYLQRLPVDIIKIDKAFVDDLGGGAPETTLARGIVELTRTLGVTALAEGVERAEQLADLRTLGCQLGQGYLFAHPLPASEVLPLLSVKRPRKTQRTARAL